MAWAGTGVIWSINKGILTSTVLGEAANNASQIATEELNFVQISDSHIGFNKPANTDVVGTSREAIMRINALPKNFPTDYYLDRCRVGARLWCWRPNLRTRKHALFLIIGGINSALLFLGELTLGLMIRARVVSAGKGTKNSFASLISSCDTILAFRVLVSAFWGSCLSNRQQSIAPIRHVAKFADRCTS